MNISFQITVRQFRERSKTVTRRIGWKRLQAGTTLTAVVKSQGLKKGETVERLGTIRAIDVRREPLARMVEDLDYGRAECIAEGFPEMSPGEFVQMFCAHNDCATNDDVTRIEFTYE